MALKIVVVGGVAAGAGAAVKARRTDEHAEIVMLERGPYVSYANCGIPYYLGRDITSRDDLFLVTPERFAARFNIDVRVNQEAVAIDTQARRVLIHRLDTREDYEESYDRLVLATGNAPVQLSLPGSDLQGIFTLWTVPDVDAILKYADAHSPRRATVVGAGFVGIEAVEALIKRGIQVTLIELAPHILPQMDVEMTSMLARHLKEQGVDVIVGDAVAGYQGDGRVARVQLKGGRIIGCDLVVSAVGVRPRLDLARKAGLKIGEAGGIVVDDHMRTSDPDIYAAGDIAESKHLVTGKPVRVPLAGPANKQGRVAGANAAGGDMRFRGVLGTMVVKVYELTAAKTGLGEKEALDNGFDPIVSYTHSADHAGYYPGAETMVIKTVADRKTGRLLGAQAVGPRGVDKRIDVMATALMAGMTVEDLEDLDLAYAPPYGSAKDPVNIAGMVAANIHRGEVDAVTPLTVAGWLADNRDFQLVDVRTPGEYNAAHIPTAVNVPLDVLRKRLTELDANRETVVYCGIGYRSYLAHQILTQNGFKKVHNLSGSWRSWTMTLPVE